MTLAINLISGCMLGFELVSGNELEDGDDVTYVVVDVLIFRFLFTFN